MHTPSSIQPSQPLRVVLSLDVEEEGLFSGHYARHACTVKNVQRLKRLVPITDTFGFPLTLFCSYTVFQNAEACRVLEDLRDRHGAEIGVHLHHWSTPPFETDESVTQGTPMRTHVLPRELLKSRLQSLLQAAHSFQTAPIESFRMGRWDLKASLFPLLYELGIHTDSSICPLRAFASGADHFLAPQTPYWPLGRDIAFLEAPVTQIPLHPFLARIWYHCNKTRPWLDTFHYLAAVSANPFWHSDAIMRLCVRLLQHRHGQVLNLFLHSSELMPGASPHVPDEHAAAHILERLRNFLSWLAMQRNAKGITLGSLFHEASIKRNTGMEDLKFPECNSFTSLTGDWLKH